MDFLKLTSNLVMFHIAIAIYHTWMAVYIIVLCNTEMYWFSSAFAHFRLNRMLCSRKGLWSSGISRMASRDVLARSKIAN